MTAVIPRTEEFVLITAVDGHKVTVTRAQNDQEGTPSVAADIKIGDGINLLAIDQDAATAALDQTDTDGLTADITVSAADTDIPAGVYDLEYRFQNAASDPTNRFTIDDTEDLTIIGDPNIF
jgi:hypothetical protein